MTAGKASKKHPYAATEHRVIDSPAYADLTFAARALLVLLTRQLTKDNNGHLQATFSYMHRFGFDAERTLSRSLKELIAHGMIYRSRAGGYQQGASQYAVCWLPIRKHEGLFLDGFKLCAWRDWKPDEKKTPPAKMQETHGKNGILSLPAHAKNTAGRDAKNTDNELIPCRGAVSGGIALDSAPPPTATMPAWMLDDLARLEAAGLAGWNCYQVPLTSTTRIPARASRHH